MLLCDCVVRSLNILDEITAEVFCPVHGRELFFKTDHGKWESSTERMKRLRRWHVCQTCGNDFFDFKTFVGVIDECNRCKKYSSVSQEMMLGIPAKGQSHQNNTLSPWRIPSREYDRNNCER